MSADPCCLECGVPLRAVVSHDGTRCLDKEACAVRRKLLKEGGEAALISPEGVTTWTREDVA